MKATELIGKKVLRTKGDDFTEFPIIILAATDTHIVFDDDPYSTANINTENFMVLDQNWCDDNWVDYDELERQAIITMSKINKERQIIRENDTKAKALKDCGFEKVKKVEIHKNDTPEGKEDISKDLFSFVNDVLNALEKELDK